MLQLAVINESTAIADGDVQKMIPAFTQQWNKDLQSVRGVDTATLTFVPKGQVAAMHRNLTPSLDGYKSMERWR